MEPAVLDRTTGSAIGRRLPSPACVFLIVFGVAKLAELADWSRLHGDVAAMLDLGSGTVTGLLIAGKGAELLLTVAAVLSLVRRNATLLLAAVTGWTADLAVLTAVAAVHGDLGRLLEHGLTFVAFAGLLAVTYRFGGVRAKDVLRFKRRERPVSRPARPAGPPMSPQPPRPAGPESHETVRDVPDSDTTRQDLPARMPAVTRLDLPVRRSADVTRQDLPVRKRPAPEPPREDRPPSQPTDSGE